MWDLVEDVATTNKIGNKILYDATSFYDRPNVTSTTPSAPVWEEGVVDVVMSHNNDFYWYTLVSVIESAW